MLDLGYRFARVQCKTGRLRNGVIVFSAKSVRGNTKQILTRRYNGEVEYFAVYCPETRGVYVVPCGEATPGQFSLRVEPVSNGQSKHVRWASDHALARFEP